MESLESLVREGYEYQGDFVRRDLWVEFESDGRYEWRIGRSPCEDEHSDDRPRRAITQLSETT